MLEDIKNKLSIVVHGANVKRWEETAKTKPPWDERNILISKFIPPGTSIIDIGSGAQTLRKYLPTGCRYQPVDLVPSSEDVIFANFNKGKIPQIGKTFDVAVCSGILEYILDPKFFITTIKNWASTVFLSYAILELNPDMKKRKENGWLNHLTLVELDDIFFSLKLQYRIRATWREQIIYELGKNLLK